MPRRNLDPTTALLAAEVILRQAEYLINLARTDPRLTANTREVIGLGRDDAAQTKLSLRHALKVCQADLKRARRRASPVISRPSGTGQTVPARAPARERTRAARSGLD